MSQRESVIRYAAGAGTGLLAGTAAVLASQAVATAVDGVTSPLLAVANRAVDVTPRPVKEWAITTFGDADKVVLIAGVIATVALLAAAIGLLGLRRPRAAVGVFLLLSAVAGAAAVTDRVATADTLPRLLPVLVLAVVGVAALVLLLRPLARRDVAGSRARPEAGSDEQGRDLPRRVPHDDLPAGFDRRAFFRAAVAVGAVTAASGVAWRTLESPEAAMARSRIRVPVPDSPAPPIPPGATLDVPGITPYISPNPEFYRVDTALTVPEVPLADYRLRVHGMVDRELDLSYEDLLSRRLVERRITLTCVSNPVGGELVDNATWIGVPMHELLAEAGVAAGADAVKSTSTDGMIIGTPLGALTDPDREALVAVAMNGEPLPLEHGFPVRMVTPGLYGYVSATKWLVDLEVTRFADFDAYWTTRGYAEKAPIKTSSRIDVPDPFARPQAGRIPVAGVAWAQDTGIRRVEVRVDDGEWREARLAAPDTINTWRQWVWEWEATPGFHTLQVRATDRTGYTQTGSRTPIAPDGATGWHSIQVNVQ